MKLLVLAGGYGTRLRSVVNKLPKALAPINGIPFLYYQIKNWKKQGIKDFVFLLHFEADMIIDFLDSQKNTLLNNCKVTYIIEPYALGTGGAIHYCINQISLNDDFLVTNADTWLGSGLKKIIKKKSPAILIVEVEDSQRYGTVHLVEDKVVRFEEKSNKKSKGLINAGLSLLNPKLFDSVQKYPFSLETEIYPNLVEANIFEGVVVTTEFIDIGVPEDYFKFIKLFKSDEI